MRFTKMHGGGKRLCVRRLSCARPPADPAALARRMSDRHCGIGGDGLILIRPSPCRRADADVQRGWVRGRDVRQRHSLRRQVRL